jgi:dipeptidase E
MSCEISSTALIIFGCFMNLYLSSYRLGDRAAVLAAMVSGNKRVGVISNALDFSTEAGWLEAGEEQECTDLEKIGLDPEPIDLRDYFDARPALQRVVRTLDAVWVVGGNTFILRRAMRHSGLDTILLERMRDNRFVYAGYSAGACVVTPTLEGLDLADDPDVVPEGYAPEVVWDGLSLVPFCIAPHYKSNHPESESVEKIVELFIADKMPFIALRDGDVYIERSKAEPDSPLVWT